MTEGLTFRTVEKDSFRNQSKFGKISVGTLKKYLHGVTVEVETKLAQMLPDKFAIAFDGWTQDGVFSSSSYLLLLIPILIMIRFQYTLCGAFCNMACRVENQQQQLQQY